MILSRIFKYLTFSVAFTFFPQLANAALQILSLDEIPQDNKTAVCAKFSHTLRQISSADLNLFFRIHGSNLSPNQVPVIKQEKDRLCAYGLENGTDYSFAFLKELSSNQGEFLKNDEKWHITTIPYRSSFSLLDVTDNDYGKTVNLRLRSLNIKEIKLMLFRIPDAEIAATVMQNEYKSAIGLNKAARLLLSGGIFIDSAVVKPHVVPNRTVFTQITLKAGLESQGTPLIIACDPNIELHSLLSYASKHNYGLWGAKLLQKRSLSVISKRHGNTLTAEVHSASSSMPIKDAVARLFSSSGKLLSTASTDASGYVVFSLPNSRNNFELLPKIAEITSPEGSVKFNLPVDIVSDVTRDSGEKMSKGGIIAVIDKLCYAPGETVHYTALARKTDLGASNIQNLRLQIISPTGATVKDLILQDQGASSFISTFDIPKDSNQGDWSARLSDPKGRVISIRHFSVKKPLLSDFFIKSPLISGEMRAGNNEFISLRALYADGSSAQGLKADGWLFFKTHRHPFENFKNYSFGADDADYGFLNDYHHFQKKITDDSGTASFSLHMPDPGYPIQANFAALFSDSSGKTESYTRSYNIPPSGNICGLRYLEQNNTLSIKLFSPQGNLVSGRVVYSVYRLTPTGVFEHTPSGWIYGIRKERSLIKSDFVDIQAAVVNSGSVKMPDEGGEYLVEAVTSRNFRSTLRFINGYAQKDLFEGDLKLQVPKDPVNVGNNAEVSFLSPYDGNAVIEVGQPPTVKRSLMNIKQGLNRFKVEIDRNLGALAHVKVQAFFSRENRGMMRASGENDIKISRPDASIKAKLGTSLNPKAGSTLSVEVISPSSLHGKTHYTAFAQLLPNTDPWDDLYENDNTDNTETIKTIFSSGITESGAGHSMFCLPVPDVEGRLKISALIWDALGTGKVERTLNIVKDSSLQIQVPEFLNENDVVVANIKIKSNQDTKARSFALNFKCGGSVACMGNQRIKLVRGETAEIYLPVTAKSGGNGFIQVDVSCGGRFFTKIKNIAVQSLVPSSLITDTVYINPGQKLIYDVQGQFKKIISARYDLSPVPYLNADGFLEALKQASFANDFEKIYALSILIDSEFSEESKDEQEKQSRRHNIQDSLNNLVAVMNDDGSLPVNFGDPRLHRLITIKAAQVLGSGLSHGYNVNDKLLAGLMRQVSIIATDPLSSAYEKAQAALVMQRNGLVAQSKQLALKLIKDSKIHSSSALALLAPVLYRCGEYSMANTALERSVKEMVKLEQIRSALNSVSENDNPMLLREAKKAFDEPVYSSSAYNAALVLLASTALGSKQHVAYATSILERNRSTISSQIQVLCTLLSQLEFINFASIESQLCSDGRFEIKNNASYPRYATVMVKGYQTATNASRNAIPYKADLTVFFDNYSTPLNRGLSIHKGDEALLILTIEGLESRILNLRLNIPKLPGLTIERFLNVNEKRFPNIRDLYPVTSYSEKNNTGTLNIGTDRGRTFRIAALVRATTAGSFVLPSVKISDSEGHSGILNIDTKGYLKIE